MRVFFLFFCFFCILFIYTRWQAVQIACANTKSCEQSLSMKVENGATGTFLGQTITAPDIDLHKHAVLGTQTTEEPKHIYVDLQNQKLYAFAGNTLFFQTLVSTGKWGRTPTGDYKIWTKIRATRMAGGSGNDAYNLPNVPYVMFFYNDQVAKDRGYSFHGAYWHDNFGHPMSHGCINMRTADAQTLYEWAEAYAAPDNPGTLVSICNQITIQPGTNPLCTE